MKKTICLCKVYRLIVCMVIMSVAGLASLSALSQEDINTLIAFADSMVEIAREKGINTEGISIEEYYITIIEEAYTDLETLFQEKGWTFEEIEKILYPTGLVMSFVHEIEEEYVLEILAEEGITNEDINLILNNAERLSNYFIVLDLDDWTEGLDMDDPGMFDLEEGDDYGNFDYPLDPGEDMPEDPPPIE
jgi:hypothetical protein